MKKVFCFLLIFVCCAALFGGCKADPQPGGDTPTANGDREPTTEALPAGALDPEALFKELAAQYPDDTAEALAARLLQNPYFRLFQLESTEFYYPALNESFSNKGVKEAACIWDMFGSSRAFVYVFTPETEADAEAILKSAEKAVDPYWSEKPFDHQLSLVTGGKAFFAMYNDGMEPVTGAIAEKARDFVEMFHAYLEEHPEASSLELAGYFAAHQKISELYAAAVEPGVLLGFGDFEHEYEVTGFAEGATFAPVISPNSFIGYVFRLEDGADADAFMKELGENANLVWNVCIGANTKIIEADGNTVLFMMCNE